MRHFNKGGESPSGIAGIADLALGEGGVIKHGKEKLAVWKDDKGNRMPFPRPAPTRAVR
jgi:hypothetical protein